MEMYAIVGAGSAVLHVCKLVLFIYCHDHFKLILYITQGQNSLFADGDPLSQSHILKGYYISADWSGHRRFCSSEKPQFYVDRNIY